MWLITQNKLLWQNDETRKKGTDFSSESVQSYVMFSKVLFKIGKFVFWN